MLFQALFIIMQIMNLLILRLGIWIVTIKEITSRINNIDADTETKKFWNKLNDEQKRWIVTGMVANAKNQSLQPLWNALGIGAKFIPLLGK